MVCQSVEWRLKMSYLALSVCSDSSHHLLWHSSLLKALPSLCIWNVLDQNGESPLFNMLEICHFGPVVCVLNCCHWRVCMCACVGKN